MRALWAAALAAAVACGNGQGARGPRGAAAGEHAAVRWRAAGAAPGLVSGRVLVRGADGGLAELDPRDGRTVRAIPLEKLEVVDSLSSRELLVARAGGPWLVGIDPASGAERWRHRCTNAETPCDLAGRGAGDRLIVYGTIEHRSPTWSIGLVALDAATGRELWRRPTRWSDHAGTALAVDGKRAFLLGPDRALAVGADGGLLWERARRAVLASGPAEIAAGGGRVAFLDGRGVRIVDGVRGRDVAWVAIGGAPALALAGDLLLAAGEDGAMTAVDAATGRVRWRARPAERLVPPILADEHAIYARTAHAGEPVGPREAAGVVALRRADGAERWRYPLGVNRSIVLAAGMLIADQAADGAREVVALAAGSTPPGRATVRGTVRAAAGLPPLGLGGLRIRIGDAVVNTDAAGGFTATIPAAGIATVVLLDRPRSVSPPPLCVGARPVRLRADVASTYQIEIVIESIELCPPV